MSTFLPAHRARGVPEKAGDRSCIQSAYWPRLPRRK